MVELLAGVLLVGLVIGGAIALSGSRFFRRMIWFCVGLYFSAALLVGVAGIVLGVTGGSLS